MRKTFRYRIYPTGKQTKALEGTLDGCRWVYNHFLEERKNAWEMEKKSLSRYGQCNTLKELKKEYPFLNDIFSQVLQDVSTRIDLAFRAFFRRVKTGGVPGYPRFRGKFRYDSFSYPQNGFKLLDGTIKLSKIGCIKIKQHRQPEGTIKTCTVRHTSTGKWFVTFACNIDHIPTEKTIESVIGLDMGIESFATLSNGERIENPRFFKKEEKALAKAQRKLSKQEKGSVTRLKARKIVARVHERIDWRRHDFAHQESRKLVNRFDTIVIEDLAINDMKKNNFRSINKSINDVAWRQFLDFISYKAEWAGGKCVKVNPAYTSQTCSQCGNRHKLKLSERVYHCVSCDLSLHRDENAALNILSLGLKTLGLAPGSRLL